MAFFASISSARLFGVARSGPRPKVGDRHSPPAIDTAANADGLARVFLKRHPTGLRTAGVANGGAESRPVVAAPASRSNGGAGSPSLRGMEPRPPRIRSSKSDLRDRAGALRHRGPNGLDRERDVSQSDCRVGRCRLRAWRVYQQLVQVAAALDAENIERARRVGVDDLSCKSMSTASYRRMLEARGMDRTGLDVDHIVPSSLGGPDNAVNYHLLPSSVNRSIGNM